MAFKLEQNPLDKNPLFAGTQQGSAKSEKQTSGRKKPTEKPEPKKAKTQPMTAMQEPIAKNDPDAFQRATFIVRKDLLDLLKDYAYTERREIKDVINEIGRLDSFQQKECLGTAIHQMDKSLYLLNCFKVR